MLALADIALPWQMRHPQCLIKALITVRVSKRFWGRTCFLEKVDRKSSGKKKNKNV